MYTQVASSTHRAVTVQEDDEPELIETKAGPRPTPQRVDLPINLFLSPSGSNTDDAGTALGEVVFHLSSGYSRFGPQRQPHAPPVIGNLSDMPEDLLDVIAGFLPHKDIANLAPVCKTWRDTLNRPRRNRIAGEWDRITLQPSVQLHMEAIGQVVNARFENLSRTAVARLHGVASPICELESAYAAATAESGDRDRKARASNSSSPVFSARVTATLGNFAAVPVMGFAGRVPGLYANWLMGALVNCFSHVATIIPASEYRPDLEIYEPYQAALGIASSLAGVIVAVQIGQTASSATYANDADFYGSLALLGSSLLSGLTYVPTAYHKVRASQARSAIQSIAPRLEERRAHARPELGPFPVAPDLSARVSKVDARIWVRIESTAPIPPQAGAEPAL